MKILYVITKSGWGGASRHVFDMATQAKKEGFEVVVALGANPTAGIEGMLKTRLDAAGVRTILINSMGRDMNVTKDAGSLGALWKIIKAEKPDVLHVHSPKAAGLAAFSGRTLRLISKKNNLKKIIYTVHGWAWNEDRPRYQKAAIAFFSWLTMLFSTDVITLSQKETEQAVKLPFTQQKIHRIPSGLTPPLFYGRKNALDFLEKHIHTIHGIVSGSPEAGIPFEKRLVVGTIAELHVNKGLVYLIEAAAEVKKKLPHFAVIIIGEGELRAELEDLIKKHGLADTVFLTGRINDASQYLKAFYAFVLPSIKEGLPYTILEAASADVPVIATAVGGIPEVIDDMKSGIIIQPKKPAEIARAIEFILEHKAEQKEYAHTLKMRVKEEFSMEKMFQKTFEVYKT